MTGPKHLVDLEAIIPGQQVHFVCPVSDCGMNFWQVWQESGPAPFGDIQCRMHEEKIFMEIVEVQDADLA